MRRNFSFRAIRNAALALSLLIVAGLSAPAARAVDICARTDVIEDLIREAIREAIQKGILDPSDTTTCDFTRDQLNTIIGLDLSYLDIISLKAGDFDNLRRLETLDLGGNMLTTLPADLFDDLARLDKLLLDNNQFTQPPTGVFDALTGLEGLWLHGNQISTLPNNVFNGMSALTTLDLSDNHLTAVGANAFSGLGALTELHLDNNRIGRGTGSLHTNAFSGLRNLTQLWLSFNEIDSLPADVFDPLTSLETLELQNNELGTLPAGAFDSLTSLENLYLYDNQLSTLPAGILQRLASLTVLSLAGNRMAALPAGAFQGLAQPLTDLYLEGNPGAPFTLNVTMSAAEDRSAAVLDIAPGAPVAIPVALTHGTDTINTTIAVGATRHVHAVPVSAADTRTVTTAAQTPALPATFVGLRIRVAAQEISLLVPVSVTLSATPATVDEGAGATALRLTATRTPSVNTPFIIRITDETGAPLCDSTDPPVSGIAASSDEYSLPASLALRFTADSDTATLDTTIMLPGDQVVEGNEIIRLCGRGPVLGVTATTLTLRDTTPLPTGLSLTLSDLSVSEAVSPAPDIIVTARLTGGVTLAAPSTIEVTVAGSGSAGVVGFFPVPSFTIDLPAGASNASGTFTLRPENDNVDEADETVTVSGVFRVGSPLSALLPSLNVMPATFTLRDDDAAPTGIALSLGAPLLTEGGSAAYDISVRVSLEGGTTLAAPSTVEVTVAGSGNAGVVSFDPVAPFTIDLPAGAEFADESFTLRPVDDAVDEADETITVRAVHAAFMADSADTLRLRDDDEAGLALTAPFRVTNEGGGEVTITVALTSQPTADIAVLVESTDPGEGTVATERLDFAPAMWDTPRTVTVTGQDDEEEDGVQSYFITFTVASTTEDAIWGALASSSLALNNADDDTAATRFLLMLDRERVTEGDPGPITISLALDGAPRTEATEVAFSTVGGTATPAADYTASVTPLTLPANESRLLMQPLTLAMVQDVLDEEDETIVIQAVADGFATGTVMLTIEDDDDPPDGYTFQVEPTALAEGGDPADIRMTLELTGGTTFATTTRVILRIQQVWGSLNMETHTLELPTGAARIETTVRMTPPADNDIYDGYRAALVHVSHSLLTLSRTIQIPIRDDENVEVAAVSNGSSQTFDLWDENDPPTEVASFQVRNTAGGDLGIMEAADGNSVALTVGSGDAQGTRITIPAVSGTSLLVNLSIPGMAPDAQVRDALRTATNAASPEDANAPPMGLRVVWIDVRPSIEDAHPVPEVTICLPREGRPFDDPAVYRYADDEWNRLDPVPAPAGPPSLVCGATNALSSFAVFLRARPDPNSDGVVDADDALVLYYTYSLRSTLGNGR